ncbi:MAG: Asp-tRNA(Asn)/Glu-tRNA(Gln) amidotransferase subunit GatC [Chloroflexi bacterium]|jgi:aspartyl-tRNA(Asn)/glutamyl-tRNA(Gln) amidotransferase subunit C|nr:Asp-tRNA(Asn)/Glu-tRNA(Gln) amidotransferase subunit GatC [Chloroflexota bacterium]MBT3669745.1 Asp-tRNA(Asn)/Glu-tRNA(Gln) amidotransferase subunit GatC [Chloroflexota bacterium]MBT4003435.1 Asp-tRNA(Asn)/Glu-tRNA(Gln) amidotransferase subunit GatC [Chloroflexota bacterium]MBT4305225.1 Asp-tRNA(Asn)/Glu-tRNA(Gln) amidotransferase subunit GatC [Chloroflexota bacterium]MBT4534852.1 Asp-tRNA(Asn)/Glu-tRNA(Gln) amidotransferase subunit GatC [Chloroflexota bacterium]
MDEKITREIFDHMVDLAALELTEEEAEYLRDQLNKQLTAVDELVAIPLDSDIQPAAHGVPYTSENSAPLRQDIHDPFPNVEDILKNAPETEDRYFIVPGIPLEDLD